MEAEIKLGKLLKDMPKHEGTKGQGRPKIGEPPIKEQPPTYKELGINYKDASAWRTMVRTLKREGQDGGKLERPLCPSSNIKEKPTLRR